MRAMWSARTVATSSFILWILLAAALLLRLAGLDYGLPFFLVSDEEVIVGGALKMAQLRTLIPSLHPELAEHLQYPPLLPYVYLVLLAPVAGVQWIVSGFPDMGRLALLLTLNPGPMWIAARLVSAVMGTATVWIVYRLARSLFDSQAVGLASGGLMAFGFLNVLFSSLARHWATTTFLIWLTVWLAWLIYRRPTTRRYIAAGVTGGLGFGVSYIGAFGLAAVVLAHVSRFKARIITRSALYLALVVTSLVAIFILLNVQTVTRLFGPGGELPIDEPMRFADYYHHLTAYLETIWFSDPVMLIFAAIGLGLLVREQPVMALIGIAAIALYGFFLFRTILPEDRFVIPALPIFAIFGGFGLGRIWERITQSGGRRLAVAAVLMTLVFAYPLAASINLVHLLTSADTRQLARTWIDQNVPQGSIIALDITGLWLNRTQASLVEQNELAPASMGLRDRLLLAAGEGSGLRRKLNLRPDFHVLNLPPLQHTGGNGPEADALWQRLMDGGYQYYVAEVRGESEQSDLLKRIRREGVRVVDFRATSKGIAPVNMRSAIIKFPSPDWFRLTRFGPVVEIYRLPWATAP